jgi:hypothetical protein
MSPIDARMPQCPQERITSSNALTEISPSIRSISRSPSPATPMTASTTKSARAPDRSRRHATRGFGSTVRRVLLAVG